MESFLVDAVKKHHKLAIELSDDLGHNPELSGKEFRSSKRIVEILAEAGFQVEYPYLGIPTAFQAVLDNGEGPAAAIMVEYDALPDIGHACGHNAHGAMAVLAALALMDLKDKFKGKLYVIGTPAEEEEGAKVPMAEQGVFDDMALATMIHSWSGGVSVPNMDVLSMRCYLIEFTGQTSHAVAAPWKGHSALAAARKFLDLIDARRECFTPDLHVNGVITDGGRQPNILPDRAEIRLELRTDSMAKLEALDEVIGKCARGAAMALDCEVSFSKGFEDFFDMIRVPVLEDEVVALFDDLGLAHESVATPNGSSDVGNVSYHCPAIQPLLSISDTMHALHTTGMRDATLEPQGHEAIATGAEIIAALTLRTLTDADFREKVQHSYSQSKAKKQSR